MKRAAAFAVLICLLSAVSPLSARSPAQAPPGETQKHASVSGKYSMLLRQIAVPLDASTYGEFHDYGRWDGTEWAGFTNLPPGYWVYLQPYWYIWRDLAADPKPDRAWGPEQATGPPNTENAGDIETAWASRTADGQSEWLMLEYAELVVPTRIKVYETFNPGAVTRITAFKPDGSEVEVWKGKDTTASADGMGVLSVPAKFGFATNRIKIEINSPAVSGWNEIDAVALVTADEKPHWATSAAASSTYAEPETPAPDETQQIIQKLEDQIRQLSEQLQLLKDRLNERTNAVGHPLVLPNYRGPGGIIILRANERGRVGSINQRATFDSVTAVKVH